MARSVVSGKFFGRLRVEYYNGRQWPLINPPGFEQFGFRLRDGRKIIPADRFVTDFATIPRLFWRILPPVGDGARARYGIAAVIHDWLYVGGRIDETPITRRNADDVFLACMTASGVAGWRRFCMYWAVRIFGAPHWRKQEKIRRRLGERQRLPQIDAERKMVKVVGVLGRTE